MPEFVNRGPNSLVFASTPLQRRRRSGPSRRTEPTRPRSQLQEVAMPLLTRGLGAACFRRSGCLAVHENGRGIRLIARSVPSRGSPERSHQDLSSFARACAPCRARRPRAETFESEDQGDKKTVIVEVHRLVR